MALLSTPDRYTRVRSQRSSAQRSRGSILFALTIAGIALPCFSAGVCTAPAALEAKVRSRPTAELYAQVGNWFGDRKQFGCAAEAFRQAATLNPDSGELAYLLGMNLYSSGKVEEAIAPLQRSIRLDPKILQPHLVLGAALDERQRTQEAEVEWRSALALEPQSATALDALTADLSAEKNFPAVIALLSTSPSPLPPGRSVALAVAFSQSGRLEEASRVLHTAYSADPSSLPVAKALAGVLVMQSRQQEAADILQASMKQHPENVDMKILYLRMLVMQDETDKARQLGTELLAASPQDWEVQCLNGILERRGGEYVPARDHLEQSVKLNPQNVACRQNFGSVLARLKDAPGARVQLEKAIALGSQDPEVRFELAAVLRTLGENEKAEEQIRLYQRETQAKSDLTQAGAKAAFGDEKLAAGEPLEAAKLYREALSSAPKEASLAYKLAMALDKAGDIAGERAALDQAIAINPGLAEAQNQLGYLASRAGETTSAEEHFREAVRISPEYAKAWINLAAILLLEAKLPEAKEAVKHALQLEPGNAQAQRLRSRLVYLRGPQ